jgi:hypothetical protein
LHAWQGWVDEDADVMGKLFGKKKASKNTDAPGEPPQPPPSKKNWWG